MAGAPMVRGSSDSHHRPCSCLPPHDRKPTGRIACLLEHWQQTLPLRKNGWVHLACPASPTFTDSHENILPDQIKALTDLVRDIEPLLRPRQCPVEEEQTVLVQRLNVFERVGPPATAFGPLFQPPGRKICVAL